MIAKELVAASTQPLILSLLSQGESYGYAIMQEIKARSPDDLRWTDGMLYPVLHRMEHNGWIQSRWADSETSPSRKRSRARPKASLHTPSSERRRDAA